MNPEPATFSSRISARVTAVTDLFTDMCSNRYPEVAPRVRALADRYGLPYNSASLTRQFGTTWLKNLRLAFPGPALPAQPA